MSMPMQVLGTASIIQNIPDHGQHRGVQTNESTIWITLGLGRSSMGSTKNRTTVESKTYMGDWEKSERITSIAAVVITTRG
jgi:hypothetical protein